MNEFPSIDLMISQLSKSIKDIEQTSLAKDQFVLKTLNATLRLALDIKHEELNYFKTKNN